MKTKRTYTAFYDDGHDCGSFIFYSEHRRGSKANLCDARKAAAHRYGYQRVKQIEIVCVQLGEFY